MAKAKKGMAEFTEFLNPVEYDLTEEGIHQAQVPMTIETVKDRLVKFGDQVSQMVSMADGILVEDEKSLILVVECGSQTKRLFNEIEKKRKDLVEEPNKFVKEVNNFCKIWTDRLKKIEEGLKAKISDYKYRQELERRKAEEKARKAREELQKKIDEESKSAGVIAPQLPEMVLPEPETVVRTEEGSAHQRKEWTFEITDEQALPREYLMPNDGVIRNAVRMGTREIPGVKIYEKTITVFRR